MTAHAFLWPDAIPGLGVRVPGAAGPCADCASHTWITYGGVALCLTDARRRAEVGK